MAPQIQTKEVIEFGQKVTLTRIVGDDGKGTCWYANPDQAWRVWERRAA